MIILETLKLIAEVITSIATATVVIVHLVKLMFKLYTPLRMFFKTTVLLFFKGCKSPSGKKIRFFKALKQRDEENRGFMKSVAPKFEMENILVLNKEALLDLISNSSAFETIQRRKD